MKARELLNLGFKQGPVIGLLIKACDRAKAHGMDSSTRKSTVTALFSEPAQFLQDAIFGPAAVEWHSVLHPELSMPYSFEDKAFTIFGEHLIDENTLDQMRNAMSLPVSVSGAIMADGHLGYGLPIGGVLATENSVIPYAVGVDIACRMCLTVLDGDVSKRFKNQQAITKVIEDNTRFGLGAEFDKPYNHDVMDETTWNSLPPELSRLKDTAHRQLGSSGGGNHFVDIGVIEFQKDFQQIPAGQYMAIMSHSGSRGIGGKTAAYYSKLAESCHPKLPPQYKRLAWLEFGTGDAEEYWMAMELMGRYASANHAMIHRSIVKELGGEVLFRAENHHNFAWRETHAGKELIVHRKGATPASSGILGVIPGSMASPAYLVSGKGNVSSLNSASHGAGRAMSRTQTKETNRWSQVNGMLKEKGVTLISAGLDEVPNGYKNIRDVMSAQAELVDIVAEFMPRIVKMSPDGESED